MKNFLQKFKIILKSIMLGIKSKIKYKVMF